MPESTRGRDVLAPCADSWATAETSGPVVVDMAAILTHPGRSPGTRGPARSPEVLGGGRAPAVGRRGPEEHRDAGDREGRTDQRGGAVSVARSDDQATEPGAERVGDVEGR